MPSKFPNSQGPGRIRNASSVLPVHVAQCVKSKGSYERFFEYKFESLPAVPPPSGSGEEEGEGGNVDNAARSQTHYTGTLNALVMLNSICVLVAGEAGEQGQRKRQQGQKDLEAGKEPMWSNKCLQSITFEANDITGDMEFSTDAISGKRKKGAIKIQAGASICRFAYTDGTLRSMVSPVSGHVLEMNTLQLSQDPTLVHSQPFGCGYIAVILPEDDLLPTLEQSMGIGENASAGIAVTVADKETGTVGSTSSSFLFSKSNLKRDHVVEGSDDWGRTIVDAGHVARAEGDNEDVADAQSQNKSQPKAVSECFAFTRDGGCLRGDRCKFAHIVKSISGESIIMNAETTLGGSSRGGKKGGKNKKKKQNPEEEERGVCYDFQAKKCTRGESCRFNH